MASKPSSTNTDQDDDGGHIATTVATEESTHHIRQNPTSASSPSSSPSPHSRARDVYVFSEENFRNPDIPSGLNVLDVPLTLATEQSLEGYGKLMSAPDDLTVEKGWFKVD